MGTKFELLAQRINRLRPKAAQHNKFVENELGDWAYVNQIAEEQVLMPKKKRWQKFVKE